MALSCRPTISYQASKASKCACFSRRSCFRPLASSRQLPSPAVSHVASKAGIGGQSSSELARLALLGAPAAVLPLLWSLPAWSDEDATVDAAFAAVQEQSAGSTDLVVSILAAIVFSLLVVVTGGVAYLGIKSWLDERQEKQDREYKPLVTSSPASSRDDDAEVKKRVRVKREKKGFGGSS